MESKIIKKSSGANKPRNLNSVAKLYRKNQNEGWIKCAEQKKGGIDRLENPCFRLEGEIVIITCVLQESDKTKIKINKLGNQSLNSYGQQIHQYHIQKQQSHIIYLKSFHYMYTKWQRHIIWRWEFRFYLGTDTKSDWFKPFNETPTWYKKTTKKTTQIRFHSRPHTIIKMNDNIVYV